MKKLLLLFVLLGCTGAYAQKPRVVRALEVEVGAGMTFGAANIGFDKTKIGELGFVELRYNMRELPLDLGFRVNGLVFGREIDRVNLNFLSTNFMVTSDLNIGRKSKFAPFVGIGVGYASFENSSQIVAHGDGEYTDDGPGGSVCFMPRVGIELFHHLRVSGYYMIEERGNRHFGLTLGVVFGGGPKN